jgi:hypothetical protein
MFITRNASRLHPRLFFDAAGIGVVVLELRLGTVIVSVSVVVELVDIVKESDDEAAAAAAATTADDEAEDSTDDGEAG